MSEAIQLENLTRTLSHIVHSLNALLNAAQAPATLQPEPPKIKKTPDMTYHDFLIKVLADKPPVQLTAKKLSYRLQEDLELLLELSTQGNITNKSFQQIVAKKRTSRTLESLKSRYSEHLSKIGEPEMRKIVDWIQKEGVQGYLAFEDKEVKISLIDPKDWPKKDDGKKEDKKRQRTTSLDVAEKKFEKKKEGKEGKKSVPTNCKDLNEILKLYSKMVNVPIKTLLQRLDQVSGDFIQLDNFIETKDTKILWSAEEDDILRKGGVQVQLLRKYRGAGVDARKNYLGIA